MSKILLTLTSPPEGMHPSQLFDDKKHLEDWLEENKVMLGDIKINAETLSLEKPEHGVLENKPNNFKNYEAPTGN